MHGPQSSMGKCKSSFMDAGRWSGSKYWLSPSASAYKPIYPQQVTCTRFIVLLWTSKGTPNALARVHDPSPSSLSIMSSSDELAKEVEAVLARRAVDQGTPTDIDLFPVYNLLLNSSKHASTSSGPSRSSRGHWYCSKASSTLHREAATYLIILFAFRPEGMSATWVTALEGVLMGCDDCARAFGSARRTFGAR